MARHPRNRLGDGYFHALNRGVGRMTLFHHPGDYRAFRALLRRVAARFRWRLLAYCLMPNHYHVILGATQPDLSAGMHRLNHRYADLFQSRYGWTGHVFQNRFGARLIEGDEYVEAACEYVLANPVRAGLTACAEDWPWSALMR